MRLTKLFLFLLPSVFAGNDVLAQQARNAVMVCYGRLNPLQVKDYEYLIVESQLYKPADIREFKKRNGKVVAYISLGEVNAHARHFEKLKKRTLGKNDIWDSYYLDMSDPKTRAVLMTLIDAGIAEGYDGFFFDNIDNFGSFGKQTAQREHLVSFLKEVNQKYPRQTFVQNAGLELIDATASYVDALLVESIATHYNFQRKKYRLRDEVQYKAAAEKLQSVANRYKLPVMVVEYADTKSLRDSAKARLNEFGFKYFIGQINLQTVPQFK